MACLFQFSSNLDRSAVANVTLSIKQATIFAPINEAFQKWDRSTTDADSLVRYHMSKYYSVSLICV